MTHPGSWPPLFPRLKRILRDLFKLQLGWDDKIPERYLNLWNTWLHELHKLSNFKVAICVKPSEFGEVKSAQFHYFTDAREIRYSAVTYIRLLNEE